jgi:hypothetical protein
MSLFLEMVISRPYKLCLGTLSCNIFKVAFGLTFIKSDTPIEKAKEDLRNALEGGVKQMLDERIIYNTKRLE